MFTIFQFILLLLLLNNFVMLITAKVSSLIRLIAIQGATLTGLLLFMPRYANTDYGHVIVLAVAVLCIKAVGFPILLARTSRKVQIAERMTPYIGHTVSVIAGVVGLLFSLWFESKLPLVQGVYQPLLFPVALSTLLTGLTIVVGRMRAITQVMGYLVAENGIFALSMPLMMGGSTWFELSLLLDVFVAVFVMGIAINHINATFESINVGRFCSLHD